MKNWYEEKKVRINPKNFPNKRIAYTIKSEVARVVIDFDDFIKSYDEELKFGK